MVKRPSIDGSHCRTKLRYSELNIHNGIKYIKEYAENCKYLVYDKIDLIPIEDDTRRKENIALWVPIHDCLSKTISSVFEDKYLSLYEEDYRKDFIFSWQNISDNPKYFYLDIFGIPCQRFNLVLENKQKYKNCRCSKEIIELKNTCNDLILILNKYALKDN